jgi:membrane protein DedA with SNARE-associated domain
MLAVFLSYLLLYKYLALFLVTLLAAFLLPLPATAFIIAAGAFASQGYFNFFEIIGVGFIGSIIGDALGYFISLHWGKDVLKRIGFRRILSSRKFVEMENYFSQYAVSTIFFTRFLVTSLGSMINILSGLSKVPPKKFLVFDWMGEFVYVALYAGLGYIVGDEWRYLSNIIEEIAIILLLLVLIFLVVRVVFFKQKHLKNVQS